MYVYFRFVKSITDKCRIWLKAHDWDDRFFLLCSFFKSIWSKHWTYWQNIWWGKLQKRVKLVQELWGILVLFMGYWYRLCWYPCFGILVITALGFKTRVDPSTCMPLHLHGIDSSDWTPVRHLPTFWQQACTCLPQQTFVNNSILPDFKCTLALVPQRLWWLSKLFFRIIISNNYTLSS